MEHFLTQYGYAAIFFVALIEAVCIPFPSEITFGATAAFAAQHEYHFTLVGVIVAAVIGEICGSVAAYFIGRSGGRALIDRYGRYVLLSHKDLDRADAFMARRGVLSVFFGRFIPLIRAVISLVAGIGEMQFGRFLASTATATALYGIGVASLGYELGANFHKYTKEFTYAGLVVVVAAVIVIGLGVLHRLRDLRTERDGTV
jgi:membrane protein DedA with SNARE-associated domain